MGVDKGALNATLYCTQCLEVAPQQRDSLSLLSEINIRPRIASPHETCLSGLRQQMCKFRNRLARVASEKFTVGLSQTTISQWRSKL